MSNNDGCVIARSNEAKALGIAMGAPWHLHRKQFEAAGVIVRSSNYTLYGDMSSRVMQVLSTFTPDLEIYSIDEAFLGMGGFGDASRTAMPGCCAQPCCNGPASRCRSASRRPRRSPRSPITPRKRIRNMAARCCCWMRRRRMRRCRNIELTDLWGVAGRLAARLKAIGINTPLDLKRGDPRLIRERLGVVTVRLALELRGVRVPRS